MEENRDRPPPGAAPDASPWTCPFCSLLCDGFRVDLTHPPRLIGSDCPRSHRGLSHFADGPRPAQARVDGGVVPLEQALDTAAQWLSRSRQPLFGGLATDVAGGRALFRLAARVGAISDHAHGRALMHGVRAQQDRGLYYTTLAEIRNRGDLIVCLGTQPSEHYPEFFRRCGMGEDLLPSRHLAFVGAPVDPGLDNLPGLATESIPLQDEDLFTTLAVLNALVAGRPVPRAGAALAVLAERLRAASYAVIVWETGRLARHGALIAEGVHQLVNTLNQRTRAASLSLGGSDGAYSVNQAYTWLSGLPLRTQAGPLGLEHEPERFDTQRLLDEGAVDLLLWVSSFTPELPPPPTALPRIVIGHPALPVAEGESIFIPVATPGIGAGGHLFRTDSSVVLPLVPLWQDGLPSVADVLTMLNDRLVSRRPE